MEYEVWYLIYKPPQYHNRWYMVNIYKCTCTNDECNNCSWYETSAKVPVHQYIVSNEQLGAQLGCFKFRNNGA